MAKPLVPDDLWTLVEPLLPPVPDCTFGGRPRISNRTALGGIVFVFKAGISWRMLPAEMGCGSGTTCWRRLRDWQQAGVWQKLHEALLTKLDSAGCIDWERASVDSARVATPTGGLDGAKPDGSRQRWRFAPSCGRPKWPAACRSEHGG